jgi:hypothetical protein
MGSLYVRITTGPSIKALIAPDPARVWRVSRHVEPRRSRGEDELARLAGQPLLAPVESAFAPDRFGLEWRFERLLN